nr:hypothetical protein [Tanacetum cinerariifolium]
GLVTDGPTVPTPPKSVTPEEDECVEETYTDPDLTEYTIKVPPPPEFTDELALITYPLDYDDNLNFDIEPVLREIEFQLYQGKDSSLKDSIDQTDLGNLDDYFVDPTPEMFTDEHAPDYSSPPRFDVY